MFIIIEKNDSKEQMMMAQALLANGLISVIERNDLKVKVANKSDEEILSAVTEVLKLFGVSSQWTAVYRVLVDFCEWPKEESVFCKRMNKLLNGVKLHFECRYQSIQKPLATHAILRKDYCAWKKYQVPQGDRMFKRQMYIAQKLLKLLSIAS